MRIMTILIGVMLNAGLIAHSVTIKDNASDALTGVEVGVGIHNGFTMVSGEQKTISEPDSVAFVVNLKSSQGLSKTVYYSDEARQWLCGQGMLGCQIQSRDIAVISDLG